MEVHSFGGNLMNLLWAFVALFHSRDAFSYPNPQYCAGDYLTLKVNTLSSDGSALRLPHYSLPFCSPPGGIVNTPLNIGQLIMGDRVQSSPYEFMINNNQTSVALCRSDPLSPLQALTLRKLIHDNYHVNFLLDHLPAKRFVDFNSPAMWTGIPIGVKKMNNFYVYNHMKFKILTKLNGGCVTVVGLEVDSGTRTSEVKEKMRIEFSYDVTFERRDIAWESRWDAYLNKWTPKALWLSISTPSIVGVFLFCWVFIHRREAGDFDDGGVLLKLESCCSSYQAPSCPILLCVAFGTGAQLVSTVCLTMVLGLVGIVSNSPRGTVISVIVYCYAFSSVAGGYAAVRLRKAIGQTGWESVTWRVAFCFPALVIFIFTILNLNYGQHSNTAILFSIMCLLWASVVVPLTFVGGYLGSKSRHVANGLSYSSRVNASSQDLLQACLGVLLLGCLPFKAIEYDLFYTVDSFWSGRHFLEFETHVVILGALVVACGEASVICNLERMHSDRLWWWKAFFGSGSCGVYVFCYLIEYRDFHQFLNSSWWIVIGHSILIGLATMLSTGAVGLLFTFLFLSFAV